MMSAIFRSTWAFEEKGVYRVVSVGDSSADVSQHQQHRMASGVVEMPHEDGVEHMAAASCSTVGCWL